MPTAEHWGDNGLGLAVAILAIKYVKHWMGFSIYPIRRSYKGTGERFLSVGPPS